MAKTCGTCAHLEFQREPSSDSPCFKCDILFNNWEPAVQKPLSDLHISAPPGFYSNKRWDDLLASSVEQIKSLSSRKGGEYAGDTDRLANFRRNAAALGLPMETVWAVYSAKHWDAVMQYIKDLNEGKTRERLEPISGRVDDLLVYLLLFKAILEETSCP